MRDTIDGAHLISLLLLPINDILIGHRNVFEQEVLHRDIGIGNIIITKRPEQGREVLIDFDNAILYKAILYKDNDPVLDDILSVCKL